MYRRVYKNVEKEQKKKFEKGLKEGKVWYRHPDYCEGYPCRGDSRYCQELQKWFYTRNCVKHHGLSAQYICKLNHEGVKIDVKADRPNPEVDIFSNAVAPEDVHADRKIKVLESEIRREKQISARLLDEVEGFKTDIEYMENKLRLSEETRRSVELDNVNLKIRLEKLHSELETEEKNRPEISMGQAMVRLEGIERLLYEFINDDD
ncbi:uncharacterized protein L199_003242 [Kwoniella botswanensis]|uniref:uncharacterized protein n=1 Tax=Kwoniella botswanensis TaxID=1268659 RepID=UPI00315C9F03